MRPHYDVFWRARENFSRTLLVGHSVCVRADVGHYGCDSTYYYYYYNDAIIKVIDR